MNDAKLTNALHILREQLQGDVLVGELDRLVYSTDASVYQEKPCAVVCPRNEGDVRAVIQFANMHKVGLIPRAAGTSLAGQVVGSGIVVDVSRYMTGVLELNRAEKWARVQPGLIRNELNQALESAGLFFGPETSTSNRATIGGMLGNNSCGSNSVAYGTTRDQTLEVTGFLADGTKTTITSQTGADGPAVIGKTLELLSAAAIQDRIRKEFPHPNVTRRNTGYAVDRLVDSKDFCHLIAGSEGTLFFATEIKVRCHDLPPAESGLLCPHFDSIDGALRATQVVMRHCRGLAGPSWHAAHSDKSANVFACELIDDFILEGAARNIEQQKNLHWVNGSPKAILIIDLRANNRDEINSLAEQIRSDLVAAGLCYDHKLIFDDSVDDVWALRRAGLGVVANVVGDAKPVTLIEDTAVAVDVLPEFIAEVNQLLATKFNASCVHYGHAGAGELHLRPVIDLKSESGVAQFKQIGTEVAAIVKRYGGSLSGEHGDGRLRGQFLRQMIGDANYELLKQVKQTWDPENIFNPGKIIDAPAMTEQLRFDATQPTRSVETLLDFSKTDGLQRAAEMCSGSGDCRKTELAGGVMCPSFMATRNEKHSTRARANVLRQVMSDPKVAKPLADERVKDVMDLCLSCKGCKSECPSNVDVARMKAEFLHQYYKTHGVPRRAKFIAGFDKLSRRAHRVPFGLGRWAANQSLLAGVVRRTNGIHPDRSLPQLSSFTFRSWFAKHNSQNQGRHEVESNEANQVVLFCDEFTNYLDVDAGIASVRLLEKFGFIVELPDHVESGRAAISQGLLDDARRLADKNVALLDGVTKGSSKRIVGIEPSALLTLRDEYPDLVSPGLKSQAEAVASRTFLIDEFISTLIEQQAVSSQLFTDESRTVRLHGHCHQKALSSMKATIRMLQLPRNYQVKMIPAGCCGMAGAFGYEQEHYEVSMQVGELVLFPTIRQEPENSIIAAGGTSCRHQILDGTGCKAFHPAEVLVDALL